MAGVSKQRIGVMRDEKQRNGIKIFINGGDNTSFIVNRIFCKYRTRNTLQND